MIALIADLHDNLSNFHLFLDRIKQESIDELWIAGDLGTPDTLDAVARSFHGPIRCVAGNLETGHDLHRYEIVAAAHPHLIWSSTSPVAWQTDTTWFTLAHFREDAWRSVKQWSPRIAAYGHSHQPHLKKFATTWLVNPGTLAGDFTPATYTLMSLGSETRLTLHRLHI